MALDRLGLTKSTLIDYPGEVAATVFTAGCNLACPYCHNPELVSGRPPAGFLSRQEVLAYLGKRRGVLGGVCITGGEPTLHPDLEELIGGIHALGLKVKLDTNGTRPDRLETLAVDYVAMDLKTTPERYDRVASADAAAGSGAGSAPGLAERVRRSVAILRERGRRDGVSYEFRTTMVPGIVSEEDLDGLCELMRPGERYVLSPFRPSVTLDPKLGSVAPYPSETLERIAEACRLRGIAARVRAL
ncbi:MAG: anaerobic ribonucleoside-triphosphate reductase activating protein [Spirochaetaceae bacterium]